MTTKNEIKCDKGEESQNFTYDVEICQISHFDSVQAASLCFYQLYNTAVFIEVYTTYVLHRRHALGRFILRGW